ncbi:MAG TPA: DUF3592 domain-containing protein [Planctomycetota bacterium]|jgi:hypothetical protein|nr:DUF3592 domain-containing protein [Planctomycetota bacterium]
MEGIVGWILVSIFGGIGAISLVPMLARGSLRWPAIQWVLLIAVGGAGACILTVAIFRTAKHYLLTSSRGRVTEGRVVDQRKEYVTLTHSSRNRDDTLFQNTGSSSWVRYHPVVEFHPEDGKTVRFQGRVYGSDKAMIPTGAMVRVYYDPGNPSSACIGTFSELWLRPLVMSVAGLVALVSGVLGFVASGRVLAAAAAEARSPEALERQVQDDLRESYNYPVHIQGTIDRVQALDVRGPALYEFVCKGVRPGGSGPEEFRSVSFPFKPGTGFVDRTVEIYLDPQEPGRYYLPMGALMREIASGPR